MRKFHYIVKYARISFLHNNNVRAELIQKSFTDKYDYTSTMVLALLMKELKLEIKHPNH